MSLPGCMFFASMAGALGPPGYGGGGSADILAGCLCEKVQFAIPTQTRSLKNKTTRCHIFVSGCNIWKDQGLLQLSNLNNAVIYSVIY